MLYACFLFLGKKSAFIGGCEWVPVVDEDIYLPRVITSSLGITDLSKSKTQH